MSTTVARPTRIRLRAWQSEALERLAARSGPDFLTVATPGAGKTTFALAAAARNLSDHPGRRLVVVAPTQHLKQQWADAAARFRIHLDADWSPRGGELPGDVHGVVTTYQQVATSAAELASVSAGAFVILDEVHHAGDDRAWGSSILTAFDGAAQRLSLSGTPFRSDSSAIPFVTYHLDEALADYEYGYGEALADGGVVRPVYFPRINGFMEWVAPDGQIVTATFDDELAREQANQRLRTALSLEGEWLPTVLRQADERLARLRAVDATAGGLVIATDQAHAQGVAEVLRRRGVRAVVATSDEDDASERIRAFGESDDEWIVAVRMVSEGVDIPRLRIAVFATTTTTELFFRQAVGRVVRHTRGLRDQRAFVFLPDDPRLRRHASDLAASRRHSLTARQAAPRAEGLDGVDGDDDAQLSLFAVIGAVATEETSMGVFAAAPDALEGREPDGVELVLEPPPLPGGGVVGSWSDGEDETGDDPEAGLDPRQRRIRLRERNADVVRELVRATGQSHPAVNAELNRLCGIRQISQATVDQLERRLEAGRKWLRQH
ncbi:MAG: DEAD/DEAH box helicase [Microthrixaceae bacterium]